LGDKQRDSQGAEAKKKLPPLAAAESE